MTASGHIRFCKGPRGITAAEVYHFGCIHRYAQDEQRASSIYAHLVPYPADYHPDFNTLHSIAPQWSLMVASSSQRTDSARQCTFLDPAQIQKRWTNRSQVKAY